MSGIEVLQAAVTSGELVIVTGAGASIGLSSPNLPAKNWRELIESGICYAEIKNKITDGQATRWKEALASDDIDELLAAAEFTGRKLGSPHGELYQRWIKDNFEMLKPGNGAMIAAFSKLAAKKVRFSTLNFDTLLEQSIDMQPINYTEQSKVMSWGRGEESGVLHLHGCWRDPSSCLLGIREYENNINDDFRNLIQRNMIAFKRVLFIGCGDTFSDPNFSALTRWMTSVLKADGLQHYALVRSSEMASRHADPTWQGFVDPISYGEGHDELAGFIASIAGPPGKASMLITKRRSRKQMPEPAVLKRYREFLIKDCGQMTIEGMRADMETAQRKFDIERLFVPLSVEAIPPVIPDTDPAKQEKMEQWVKKNPAPVPFGKALASNQRLALLALPGGGKTILLKRLAVAYADPSRRASSDDSLPEKKLFPVMIRCREWREHIRKPILSLLENIGEITGQHHLSGLSIEITKIARSGNLLLLVDGLDEIHDDADRTIFVENLETFLSDFPKARFVTTSREAGFSLVAPCLTRFCSKWRVAPLNDHAIILLCQYWHNLMNGESQDSIDEAESLSTILVQNQALRRLAENPLLLTMLLVVKHGAGRLPPDRVSLYERAVEVLLDTWNIKGHEALNTREAVPQLACAAFEMMKNGWQTGTEKQLLALIEDARDKIPMIRRYTTDTPHQFLKRVELRSSLLVEAGHVSENRKTVPFYQFRHLTFQEYLSAVAAVEGHHTGYRKGETVLDPLQPFLLAEEWKEVIPMAAVLARKSGEPLLAALVEEGKKERDKFLKTGRMHDERDHSYKPPAAISRLVQCLVEEAEFSPDTLIESLRLVALFARGCNSGGDNWKALSRGPYGDDLRYQVWMMYETGDWPAEAWVRNTLALLLALRQDHSYWISTAGVNEIRNKILSNRDQDKVEGLLTICGCFWGKIGGEKCENLCRLSDIVLNELFNENKIVWEAAGWAVAFMMKVENSNIVVDRKLLDRSSELLLIDGLDGNVTISGHLFSVMLDHSNIDWKPDINNQQRSTIKDFMANYNKSDLRDIYLMQGLALLGFSAGMSFTSQEVLPLIERANRGYWSAGEAKLRDYLSQYPELKKKPVRQKRRSGRAMAASA